MTLSAAARAFDALIDYAGLFPPAQLSMAAAYDEYRRAQCGPHAKLLGRFILPASRMGEFLALPLQETVALSVIVDTGADARAWLSQVDARLEMIARQRASEPRVCIEALEVPLPPLAALRDTDEASIGQWAAVASRHGLRDLPVYVEPYRDPRLSERLPATLASLARFRMGAKFRCGGLSSDAVPASSDLAQWIVAAYESGVPFKATAGLHHPLRHFNADAGFVMHGFLNVLAGAAYADRGKEAVAVLLEAEDASAFAALDARHVELARERFVSFGSCSFAEPIEDLTALGLLESHA